MAIVATYLSTNAKVVVLGTGYGLAMSDKNPMFGARGKKEEKVAVFGGAGTIFWVKYTDLVIESVDGQSLTEFFKDK